MIAKFQMERQVGRFWAHFKPFMPHFQEWDCVSFPNDSQNCVDKIITLAPRPMRASGAHPQRRRLAPGKPTVWGKNLSSFGWVWAVFGDIFKSTRVSISDFQKFQNLIVSTALRMPRIRRQVR